MEEVIDAFISSCHDYSNSLYFGSSQSCLSHSQLVQNAAARVLIRSKKRERITPILASLHCLTRSYRIDFKILMFVHKALNGSAPLTLQNSYPHITLSENWDRLTKNFFLSRVSGQSVLETGHSLLLPQNYEIVFLSSSDSPRLLRYLRVILTHFYISSF